MAKADLSYYQDAAGHVFSLTPGDAKLLGYAPVDITTVRTRNAAADRERVAAAQDAGLSEREQALADGEAKLKADREAFLKEQAEAKSGNKGR